MGAQMVREVASKTSDIAGDGTTTATVLAAAIVREGAKAVAAGMNPMDLKRGVDLAVEAIVVDLKKNSKKVDSNDEIAQVGAISANGERYRDGRLPGQSDAELGNGGVITVEESKSSSRRSFDVVEEHAHSTAATSRPISSANARENAGGDGRPLHPNLRQGLSGITECCLCLKQWCKSGKSLLIVAEDVEGEHSNSCRQQVARRLEYRSSEGARIRWFVARLCCSGYPRSSPVDRRYRKILT